MAEKKMIAVVGATSAGRRPGTRYSGETGGAFQARALTPNPRAEKAAELARG